MAIQSLIAHPLRMANLKASIDFGLVHIPVEIVTAEDSEESVSFHMLDSKDQSRVRLKRVNENSGKEVEWEDIVKGYEVEKGKYVIFTEEEIKELQAEANKSLNIDVVVDKDEIDPALFETPYFIKPLKGGEKGYAILEKVLAETQKYAVIQAVLRTREQLGVLYSKDGAIMLGIIRYPNELKKPSDVLDAKEVKVSDKEIKMAEKLLDQMSGKFKPSLYKDTYIDKLHAAIKQKMSKKKFTRTTHSEKKKSSGSVDIMKLLESSLKDRSRKGTKRKKAA